jgi:hypothetical protein
MLKILIEKIAEALVNALNGKIRKIYTALSVRAPGSMARKNPGSF